MLVTRTPVSQTRIATLPVLLAALLLVTAPMLSKAHDFMHHEHEPSQLCDLYNISGAPAAAAHDTPDFFDRTLTHTITLAGSIVETSIILSRHSRAPPSKSQR